MKTEETGEPMATKKLISADVWEEDWFIPLPPRLKCLYLYIYTRSSICGAWKPKLSAASAMIGDAYTAEDIAALGDKIQTLPDGTLWLKHYLSEQFPNGLSNASTLTTAIRREMDALGLDIPVSVTGGKAACLDGPAMPADGWEMEHVLRTADKHTVALTKAKAMDYYDARTRTSPPWTDASGRDVARTQRGLEADMRRWKTLSQTDRPSAGHPARDSVFSLKEKIATAKAEIEAMPQYENDMTETQRSRKAMLWTKIREWRRQIVE